MYLVLQEDGWEVGRIREEIRRGRRADGEGRHVSASWFFFFQAEDGIRDLTVTGVQTCALPIWPVAPDIRPRPRGRRRARRTESTRDLHVSAGCAAAVERRPRQRRARPRAGRPRSEEHTSELQSQSNLVCRLLLEKKKTTMNRAYTIVTSTTTAKNANALFRIRISSRWTSSSSATITPAHRLIVGLKILTYKPTAC